MKKNEKKKSFGKKNRYIVSDEVTFPNGGFYRRKNVYNFFQCFEKKSCGVTFFEILC